MTNIIILAALGGVAVVFLFVTRRAGNKSETTSFISTLIATLIGVLLAVSLSNWEKENEEIEDTIKLLKSARNTLDVTYGYVEKLESHFNEMSDSGVSDSIINPQKEINPLPYPHQLENIISSEIISKNLSDFSHLQIHNGLFNLPGLADYTYINVYKLQLEELSLIINLEIRYQNGEITEDEVRSIFWASKKDIMENFSSESVDLVQSPTDED